MPEENDEIYLQAINAWGTGSQLDMLVEECAELIVAVKQHRRGRVGVEAVAEEIADVQIMTEAVSLLVGAKKVADIKQSKLDRLRERLKNPSETL